MAIALQEKGNFLLRSGKSEKMKHLKGPVTQTTLGNLIAVLCDETWPFLKNDRDVSMVVGYILNDLMLRNRGNRIGLGRKPPARNGEEKKR